MGEGVGSGEERVGFLFLGGGGGGVGSGGGGGRVERGVTVDVNGEVKCL